MLLPDHQADAILFALDNLRDKKRCLVQMPCGAGADQVGLHVAEEWLRDGKVIWLTTWANKIGALYFAAKKFGIKPQIQTDDRTVSVEDRFILCTYDLAWSRMQRHFEAGALLILDEAHHVNAHTKTSLSIYQRFNYILGLSSSPWSKSCFDLFEKFHTYPLSASIKDGFTAKFEIHDYEPVPKGKHQIVFTPTNLTARRAAKLMTHTDWLMYERDKEFVLYKKFVEGRVGTALINQTRLIEDFDKPDVKKVWIERDCKSPILAYQMLSRVFRRNGDQVGHCHVMHWETKQSLRQALGLAG